MPPLATSVEAATDDLLVLEERVARARARLVRTPGGIPLQPPAGSESGTPVKTTTTRFTRDPQIIAWMLETVNGVCEVCDRPAPFLRPDGYPYLEVHHVRPLADGGPDKVDNTIGVCPNCHRQLHYGTARGDLRAKVIAKVKRILDYPAGAVATVEIEDVTA